MLMRWQQWDHHVLPRVTLMLPVIDACRLVFTVSGVCFSSGSVHRLTRLLNHRIIDKMLLVEDVGGSGSAVMCTII